MSSRRDFLKSSSLLSGSLGFLGKVPVFAAEQSKPSAYFGVHPFVEQHPEAVFIMRTNVDYKTNSEACKQVGLNLGRSLFVPMDSTRHSGDKFIAAKPNLTGSRCSTTRRRAFTPLEDTMGIATDVFFVEGLFELLEGIGSRGNRIHTRDANGEGVIEPADMSLWASAWARPWPRLKTPLRHGKMRMMPRPLSGRRFPAA